MSEPEKIADELIQTGESAQAPAEGDTSQSERNDESHGKSSEAPATG